MPILLPILLLLSQQPAPGTMAPIPDDEESAGYQLGAGVPAYDAAPEFREPAPRAERTGVTLERYDRSVEARFGSPDPFYEATVRGGAAMAQGRQGALDGGWTLSGGNGAELYALQLADSSEGGVVEGAWRSLTKSAARDTGFIALIGREPGRTVLRFFEPGARAPTTVTLEPVLDGSWRGELARAEAGAAPLAVTMRRRRP